MIAHSWDGLGTTQIADHWGCRTGGRCGSGCTRSTPRVSTGSATGQDPANLAGSPDRAWPARRLGPPGPDRPAGQAGRGPLAAVDPQEPGAWTLDALAEAAHEWASPSSAARSAGSCLRRGHAGGPAFVDGQPRPRLRPKRARVIDLYTHPPAGVTVICADELGPVVPRTFPPAPGWSADGHRVRRHWTTAAGRRRPGCMAGCVWPRAKTVT